MKNTFFVLPIIKIGCSYYGYGAYKGDLNINPNSIIKIKIDTALIDFKIDSCLKNDHDFRLVITPLRVDSYKGFNDRFMRTAEVLIGKERLYSILFSKF